MELCRAHTNHATGFGGRSAGVVVHLGANSSTQQTDGEQALAYNYRVATALYERLEPGVKFIYASSASVYGVHGKTPEDFSEDPKNERPVSPYAFSKWMLDKYMRRAHTSRLRNAKKNPAIGLRFFNVYGPGEQHKDEMASFAHKLIAQYRAARWPYSSPVECPFIDGRAWSEKCIRDFVYIDDVVNVIMWAINQDVAPGIYNVGSGVSRSFVDVADTIKTFGRLHNLAYMRESSAPSTLTAYQQVTYAPLERLRAAGYTDKFLTLEEGLVRFWNAMMPDYRVEQP